MSSSNSTKQHLSGTLGETRVQDVLLDVEQMSHDARVWFETEYGMGEVLFHGGQMVKARLGGARGQTALLRLIAITEGKFGVESCSVSAEPAIMQSVGYLIELHGAREAEWKELCSHSPPLSSVLRLTAGGSDVRDSSRGIQRVILVLIDGRRTLMQILEESSFDPVEALKLVTKALDDDLAQISPQATSLFPLAPAGDASGVLPRFTPHPAVPRLDPTTMSAEQGPPTWRHATLVGVGTKPSTTSKSSDGLAPARIIDIGRRPSTSNVPDSNRGVEVNSVVKTVIQGFGLGRKASAVRAALELSASSGIGKSDSEQRVAVRGTSARADSSSDAPQQRIIDIVPDAFQPSSDYSTGDSGPLSAHYPADASGPKRDGQRRYIDRYEILLRIGRGGTGTVYLARLSSSEIGFRRLFAVKLLRSHLSLDTQAATEFLEEARIAGSLHHANVVAVYDAGFHGKQPYLVMDYVEGCSFKQLTQGLANSSPYFFLPIVIDALSGLQAVHTIQDELGAELKLVHCDVSPENMLVGVDGICRLTDFGMARKASRVPGVTNRGQPEYMAPEQITGNSVDHRADIFSMGVVLWNVLTGNRLFTGESAEEIFAQVCNKPILPPSAQGAHTSRMLDDIVMRALSRDPNVRFDSAEEMLTALRRAAASLGGLATPKEIASWVRESSGIELTQRRLAILDASRNNPTIPPPPAEESTRASDTTGTADRTVEKQSAPNAPHFSSSSAPPEMRPKAADKNGSATRPGEHSSADDAKRTEIPRTDASVAAFFYGVDDYESRQPPSSRAASIRAAVEPRHGSAIFARRFRNPWVLVGLLALVVALALIVLVRMHPKNASVPSSASRLQSSVIDDRSRFKELGFLKSRRATLATEPAVAAFDVNPERQLELA